MPERPLLVAAYAAGAGLAAATLVYVFGPTFLLEDSTRSPQGAKKRNIVGLSNPANDCFINSVLQALAGSPQLRLYLIKEVHLRKIHASDLVSLSQPPTDRNEQKRASLQLGLITIGLKDILDALNERPIHRKTISAQPMIAAVERAFNTRVSRYQQDAQEFLQLVLERLADEHKEMSRLRKQVPKDPMTTTSTEQDVEVLQHLVHDASINDKCSDSQPAASHVADDPHQTVDNHEPKVSAADERSQADVLPFEGNLESQIECSACGFKPTPSVSDFVTLTLNVPNSSGSATLDTCFDGVLKVEYIEGFRCDRCRLRHALQVKMAKLADTSLTADQRTQLQHQRTRIEELIDNNPENPPQNLDLPPIASAPSSRISKHMRISLFPRVLAIHLSRSMWDAHSSSSKNMAKISFPETLMLGHLLDRKTYHLFAMVTHKGGHNSGHYETFRRHWVQPPYSAPTNTATLGLYSPNVTPAPSPRVDATIPEDAGDTLNALSTGVDLDTAPAYQTASSDVKTGSTTGTNGQSLHPESVKHASEKHASILAKHKRRALNRWWRISDDKIKECKASDVLSMQREVYLLFYELQ